MCLNIINIILLVSSGPGDLYGITWYRPNIEIKIPITDNYVHIMHPSLCLLPLAHMPHALSEPHSIIHEGWCVKESGTALFGKTNWRRRWFRLIQTKRDILLQYYRSDTIPCLCAYMVVNVLS